MKGSDCEDVGKIRLIQRVFLLFSPDSTLERLLLFQVVQRDMPDPGKIFWVLHRFMRCPCPLS